MRMVEAKTLTCFKAYDVRGKLCQELNEDIIYQIGRPHAQYLNAKRMVVGCDIRLSSASSKQALINGLIDSGVDAIDIGMTDTEEIYFSAFHLDADSSIEVTASYNPIDYNGLKFVRRGAPPIGGDSGLRERQSLAENNIFAEVAKKGTTIKQSPLTPYVNHLIGHLVVNNLKPLKIVVNAGNGTAGQVIDALEQKISELRIPFSFIKVNHHADRNFPNGILNPILIEDRASTENAVKDNQADLGVAWDGDFDRCFLFDENGDFIEGYYIAGLLAEAFLIKHPNEKIIYDPRLTWNTIELICVANKPLSSLVSKRIVLYPCSGEINYTVENTQSAIKKVLDFYFEQNPKIDKTDGISLDFGDWYFNLRPSNTEPLLRLNVETKANGEALWYHVGQLEKRITTQ